MAERLLYLVRHGETTGESSIRYHGRNDVPLSDLGRDQVRQLVPLVGPVPFTTVVASPLVRAQESAEILVRNLAEEPDEFELAPDLAEVHFGDMEGLTDAEIAAQLPDFYRDWKSNRVDGYPNGETYQGFAERIQRAFDGVLARHTNGNLLVVAHKGVIKRGVAHLLGVSEEMVRRIDLDLGSLTVLRKTDDGFQLRHLNLTPMYF